MSDWSSDVCSSDLDETDAPMQRRIASDHAIEGDILLDGEGAFDLVVHRAHYAAASMSVRAKSLPLNNSGSSVALASASEKQSPKFRPALRSEERRGGKEGVS